jgi:uncharacterized DUF497 family protein
MKLKKSFSIGPGIALLKQGTGRDKTYTQLVDRLMAGDTFVFFVRKSDNRALVLSARDIDKAERRLYERK